MGREFTSKPKEYWKKIQQQRQFRKRAKYISYDAPPLDYTKTKFKPASIIRRDGTTIKRSDHDNCTLGRK